MTEHNLKNGDRARFTVEGEVRQTAGGYFVKSPLGHESFVHIKQIVAVKLLAPALPAAEESVILARQVAGTGRRLVYVRTISGWKSPRTGNYFNPEDFEDVQIIHDAGKGK